MIKNEEDIKEKIIERMIDKDNKNSYSNTDYICT